MITMVREGKKVWPTCPNCSCRLEIFENDFFINLRHFFVVGDKDARGCKCSHVDSEWTYPKKSVSHLGYC